MDKKMSNEEMVKEAVEEAKKAAEAEAKEQEAKGQEPEDAEETEATEEEAVGKETNSEDAEEPKKKKLFEKKNKKDKKDEQIADLTDKLTRHMAEFDNYRKRTEKEKSAMYEIGAKDVVEKILPIVDNFERGLRSVPEEKKDDPFVDGMDKIYKQMMSTLEGIGVKPIEAVGQEFDPNFHNAVMHVEDEELGENVARLIPLCQLLMSIPFNAIPLLLLLFFSCLLDDLMDVGTQSCNNNALRYGCENCGQHILCSCEMCGRCHPDPADDNACRPKRDRNIFIFDKFCLFKCNSEKV